MFIKHKQIGNFLWDAIICLVFLQHWAPYDEPPIYHFKVKQLLLTFSWAENIKQSNISTNITFLQHITKYEHYLTFSNWLCLTQPALLCAHSLTGMTNNKPHGCPPCWGSISGRMPSIIIFTVKFRRIYPCPIGIRNSSPSR